MALFRRLFHRKPPDRLLEISDRVYVFGCCFSTEIPQEDECKVYIGGIMAQLQGHFPDASFMVCNFRGDGLRSRISDILSEYGMTIMDYPWQYEGCPVLPLEMIHHFLRSSESWLSLEGQHNALLMHCERGGWPVLAFMLAGLLLYRKQYTGEQKTLEMVYKQAPKELLHLLSPLNPQPSHLRYLQYISRRGNGSDGPLQNAPFTLECVILRIIPSFDGEGGCRILVRVYGQDPLTLGNRSPKLLFSSPKTRKYIRHKEVDNASVKINVHCCVQGDVVIECINMDEDMECEQMMFRVMFNTAFVQSNIMVLDHEEVDVPWNAKEQLPRDFKAEVLFSDFDAAESDATTEATSEDGNKTEDALTAEFFQAEEILSNTDWQMGRDSDFQSKDALDDEATSPELQSLDNEMRSKSATSHAEQDSEIIIAHQPTIVIGTSIDIEIPTQPHQMQRSSETSSAECDVGIVTEVVSPKDIITYEYKSTLETGNFKQDLREMATLSFQEKSTPTKSFKQESNGSITQKRTTFVDTGSTREAPISLDEMKKRSEINDLMHGTKNDIARNTFLVDDESQKVGSPGGVDETISCKGKASNGSDFNKIDTYSQIRLETPTVADQVEVRSHAKIIEHDIKIVAEKLITCDDAITVEKKSIFEVTNVKQEIGNPLDEELSTINTRNNRQDTKSILKQKTIACSSTSENSEISTSAEEAKSRLEKNDPRKKTILDDRSHKIGTSSVKNEIRCKPETHDHKTETDDFVSQDKVEVKVQNQKMGIDTQKQSPEKSLHTMSQKPPSSINSSSDPARPKEMIKQQEALSESTKPTPKKVSDATSGHVLRQSLPLPPPPPPPLGGKIPPPPPCMPGSQANARGLPSNPLVGGRGRGLIRPVSSSPSYVSPRRSSLKPLHWVKVTRAVQGSLWAELQQNNDADSASEFDVSELETLFPAVVPKSGDGSKSEGRRKSLGAKSEKVHLIELRRAYNTEIMLTKIKTPLSHLMSAALALDDSILDVDQVENLIKFCPTKEEMELLKNYTGDVGRLGKCEQFFLELMKVPRVESKLRVFSFKTQFGSQVADLRKSLKTIDSACEEIRNSVKLKEIMKRILHLGNTLNQGTARGSAIGFRLDGLLKLTETRANDNKMTLMHYLCKTLASRSEHLLDFHEDLVSLEAASKIQLKILAEEMQAIVKGLEKVELELTASERDGPVSDIFCRILKEFIAVAAAEVRSLSALYTAVGRNADALGLYFGEDPARCPFEQVIVTLLNFVKLFRRAHEENCKQAELEKKKAQKEAEIEKSKVATSTNKKY